jgi:MFS superfamily sulfate permease-like transporter
MAEYKAKFMRLVDVYGPKGIASALIGGFVFATLLFLPMFIAAAEIASLYLHVIALMSTIIWTLTEIYVFVFCILVKQALVLKNKDSGVDHEYLFKVHWIALSAFVVLAGLVYFIWLMPLWF